MQSAIIHEKKSYNYPIMYTAVMYNINTMSVFSHFLCDHNWGVTHYFVDGECTVMGDFGGYIQSIELV